ncbi:MAG: ABC transporter substrate-binding protein [Clostridia bacterium]|nr:ABC transporter substrate-binding protein [Clostridia bacterium]
MRRIGSILLTVALCAATLTGCGQTAPQPTPGTDLSITDMMGRAVTVPANPQRVVALLASDVEILYAIGAGDLVAGVGEYCNYPESVADKPVVASGAETNVEQIIALAPDVVIMGAMAQDDAQVRQLEKAGIPVVETNASDIAGVYEAIRLIGTVTGRDADAEQLAADMESGFLEVAKRAGDGSKRIYFEVSPLEYGLWTAGTSTFMQELCDLLNLENIFSDVQGWAEISEEQVLQRDPDYIATVTMYYGEGPTPDEEIRGRQGWQDMTAVKEVRIYCADNDMLTRPGPRLVEAARLLADFVYGPASNG